VRRQRDKHLYGGGSDTKRKRGHQEQNNIGSARHHSQRDAESGKCQQNESSIFQEIAEWGEKD
jgi:hypothetical protein